MSYIFKKIVMVLGVTILIAVAYYTLNSVNKTDTAIKGETQKQDFAQKSSKILSDTKKIKTLNLDTSFFADQRFSSLKNTRVELIDSATGRTNPFDVY